MGGWATGVAGAAGAGLLLWLGLLLALWITGPTALTARAALRLLPDVIRLLRRLAGDPGLPPGVRVRIWLVLGYLALPIDLVPDFLPVVGWADDVVVAALGLRAVVRHAGPAALQRHWPGDPDGLRAVQRLAGMPVA
jgi:uncharacterized membrane protein YkvA (DUF1232 family)